MKTNLQNKTAAAVNAEVSAAIDQHQMQKYHTKQGHGFAAEDANALHDVLCGRKVQKIGVSNELCGADRIVDGVQVQSKYCQTARASVNNAFGGPEGLYAYEGQVLEVPRDQYEEAVKLFAEKIRQGKVPGVTDPNQARAIVKRGHVTYQQARNIAKAGTVDSLIFDIKTQTITSATAFGLSFALSYAYSRYQGLSPQESLKIAFKTSVKSGLVTITAGVITSQVLRKVGEKTTERLTEAMVARMVQTKLGQSIAQGLGLNAAKALSRSTLVSSVVTLGISSAIDLTKLAKGKITGRQFGINFVSNVSGIAGGVYGMGKGAALGTMLCPGVGTILGGIAGSLIGGVGAAFVTQKVLSAFCEEDYDIIIDHVYLSISRLSSELKLTATQLERMLEQVKRDRLFEQKFFSHVFNETKGKETAVGIYLYKRLRPYALRVQAA